MFGANVAALKLCNKIWEYLYWTIREHIMYKHILDTEHNDNKYNTRLLLLPMTGQYTYQLTNDRPVWSNFIMTVKGF